MSTEKVNLTISVDPEQRDDWKTLAEYNKRSLSKQIAHELDTAYSEMVRNLK